jgi:hypothetical protein
MKKTLVALAVLAASGASFAQVTITGDLEMGYAASSGPAGDKSGLGVDTSEIYFNAVEDLGAGMKISASMGLIGLDRSGESNGSQNVLGHDAILALSGGFGTFKLATYRAGDYLSGGASSVAAAPGLDGKVFGARSYRDTIQYASPELVKGLTVSLYHGEPNFQTNAANDTGLGAGAMGSSLQRKNIYGVTYKTGGLIATADYNTMDNQIDTATSTSDKNAGRISGSYDFGVAKVGLGSVVTKKVNGTVTDLFAGVSAPFGAFTVGANWGSTKTDGVPGTTDGTRTGYGLGARYDLSKSTAVWYQYARWDSANSGVPTSSAHEIALAKSF